MNFQQVLQAKGQKDAQGYDLKVTMLARFGANMEFGQTQAGKPKCSVKLTDKDNVTHKVYLYGTLPTVAMCTQKAEFNIAAFDGQGQQGAYVGYSGFWNSRATIIQDGQGQQPQGQPQQAAAAAIADKPVDWDGKQQREFRSHAIHSATLLVVALAEVSKESRGMSPELVVQMAETYVKYVYNGRESVPNVQGSTPPQAADGGYGEPPVGDDDIPFNGA